MAGFLFRSIRTNGCTPVDCGCYVDSRRSLLPGRPFMTGGRLRKVLEFAKSKALLLGLGIELSRRFRALKVWLTLKYYGATRLAAAIADDIAMANYMAECVVRMRNLNCWRRSN
jgi:hypothetical protein